MFTWAILWGVSQGIMLSQFWLLLAIIADINIIALVITEVCNIIKHIFSMIKDIVGFFKKGVKNDV